MCPQPLSMAPSRAERGEGTTACRWALRRLDGTHRSMPRTLAQHWWCARVVAHWASQCVHLAPLWTPSARNRTCNCASGAARPLNGWSTRRCSLAQMLTGTVLPCCPPKTCTSRPACLTCWLQGTSTSALQLLLRCRMRVAWLWTLGECICWQQGQGAVTRTRHVQYLRY